MTTAQGFSFFTGGMNSAVVPAALGDQQYSRGINVSSRGGYIRTRPGLKKLDYALPPGDYQGAGRWSLDDGDRLVMVVEIGRAHV